MRIGRVGCDADVVAYRAAAIAEPTYYDITANGIVVETCRYKKEADSWVSLQPEDKRGIFEIVPRKELAPASHACQVVKTILLDMTARLNPIEFKLYLSSDDKSNFRYKVAQTKPYKGNRGEKPTHLAAVNEYLVNKWGAEVVYGEEADDALGRFQYEDAVLCESEYAFDIYNFTCIASTDKDLKQIPGLHYDFVNKKFSWVTRMEGKRFLYEQILTGDSTDNIPGLKGIGPATAKKLLVGKYTEEEMEEVVRAEYQKKHPENWEAYLEEQRLLVAIRTE